VVQTLIVVAWIAANIIAVVHRWDPYPFILLNLLFSTQAAYAAPLILLSQTRQADTDRVKAEHDYQINQLALQYLIAWHANAHGKDCRCVQESKPVVENILTSPGTRPVKRRQPALPIDRYRTITHIGLAAQDAYC
jgi:uncharacterized membrane protein